MFINSRLYAIKGGQRVKTGSKEEVEFQGLGGRKVVGQFDGGRIITDAGTLLLGEAEHARGFLGDFSKCFTDYRNQDAIEHTVEELVSQRIYGIALGYEDVNGHDQLRIGPFLAALCKKQCPTGQQRRCRDDTGKALAGKSTLNRLELTPRDARKRESIQEDSVSYRGDRAIFC